MLSFIFIPLSTCFQMKFKIQKHISKKVPVRIPFCRLRVREFELG